MYNNGGYNKRVKGYFRSRTVRIISNASERSSIRGNVEGRKERRSLRSHTVQARRANGADNNSDIASSTAILPEKEIITCAKGVADIFNVLSSETNMAHSSSSNLDTARENVHAHSEGNDSIFEHSAELCGYFESNNQQHQVNQLDEERKAVQSFLQLIEGTFVPIIAC